MKELVSVIAKSLVDNPDAVDVTEVSGRHSSVIKLRVSKSDFGKVIGKRGVTATAIRTILSAASARSRKNTILEIVE